VNFDVLFLQVSALSQHFGTPRKLAPLRIGKSSKVAIPTSDADLGIEVDRPKLGGTEGIVNTFQKQEAALTEKIPPGPSKTSADEIAVTDEMQPTKEETTHAAELPEEPESCHGEVAKVDEPDFDNEGSSSRAVSLQNLTDDQFINEIMEHFNDFDTEDPPSGCIPSELLGTVLDALADDGIIAPVDEDELEMLKNDMDADGNGLIPADEFKEVLERRRKGEDFSDDELREAFGVFDHHNKGYITPMELRQAMKAIFDMDVPALDANSMIMAASRSGGDRIDLEEFMGIIRWKKDCL
jgi:Ca2+-binding EF-hand superfamily protein